MNVEKKDVDIFLILWIRNHPEFWSELKDIQISILVNRIVKEKSFKQLAYDYKVTEERMKLLFDGILQKIETYISPDVAKYLRVINRKLNARPDKPFEVIEIHMN